MRAETICVPDAVACASQTLTRAGSNANNATRNHDLPELMAQVEEKQEDGHAVSRTTRVAWA